MYCGLDVSKQKSNVCILGADKKVVAEFEIPHTKEGFEKLTSHLSKEAIIGMECTGNCSTAIYHYLKVRYSNVVFVDNVQMSNFARLHYPTIKNDKLDAKLTAMYLTYDLRKIIPTEYGELADLVRLYNRTMKEQKRYKQLFKDQLSIIFPELDSLSRFCNTRALPNLLLQFPTPKMIATASTQQVFDALTGSLKRKRYTLAHANKLQEIARSSVGVPDYPVTNFLQTLKFMLFYQQHIRELKVSMDICLEKTPYVALLQEWGYSTASLAIIVGEVGDVRRFSNHKKFVKYCGLDVSEETSGTSVNKQSRITKRGRRALRSLFYMMALMHMAMKTELSKFYHHLREKGKHPMKCQIALTRKVAVKAYFDLLKCHEGA